MGLLLGLPLRLLGLLAALARFLLPLALLALAVYLLRRKRQNGADPAASEKKDAPHFDGPVYTVDYEDVPDSDGEERP